MKFHRCFAVILLLLLARHGNAQDVAQSVVAGIEAYNRGDVATAYRLLKAAADDGDSDAQVNLGYLYACGQGVAENQPEAFRLYLSSAKQGNAEGMNAVGFKYRYGTGIKRDVGQAVHWFCGAAVSGDPRGLNNLGILYLEGTGVERDIGEARRLWKQAAERGNPNAMQNLGQSLLGPDEPTDRNEGARWLIASAHLGNGNAQRILRQLGYRDSLPPVVETQLEMRRALKDLPPGKARDCGFLVS